MAPDDLVPGQMYMLTALAGDLRVYLTIPRTSELTRNTAKHIQTANLKPFMFLGHNRDMLYVLFPGALGYIFWYEEYRNGMEPWS